MVSYLATLPPITAPPPVVNNSAAAAIVDLMYVNGLMLLGYHELYRNPASPAAFCRVAEAWMRLPFAFAQFATIWCIPPPRLH